MILYSIFPIDLPFVLNNAKVMYADSTMYSAAMTNTELSDVLSIEESGKKVADWVYKNKLVLNFAKRNL